MMRAGLVVVLALTGCARDQVCLGHCDELGLGGSSSGEVASAESSSDEGSSDEGSSSDETSAELDEVPDGWERVCDPDDPCATLPATATFYIDHCSEFGGTVYDDATECIVAFDLCLAYVRQTQLGVYCMFAGVEIHREEFVAGACDEYGASELCISPV